MFSIPLVQRKNKQRTQDENDDCKTKALCALTGSNDDGLEMTLLSRQLKLTLMILCITNFLDLIGYMALFSSLFFMCESMVEPMTSTV